MPIGLAAPSSLSVSTRETDRRHRREIASLTRLLMQDVIGAAGATANVGVGPQPDDEKVELVPTEPVYRSGKLLVHSVALRLSDPM